MKLDVQKYFETSTIHGLIYVTKQYHLVERIFWIIVQIFSVICTLILFTELVIKVQNFPIVTYLSDQSISVSEVIIITQRCSNYAPKNSECVNSSSECVPDACNTTYCSAALKINFPAVSVCPRLKLNTEGIRRLGGKNEYGFYPYRFEKHSLSVLFYEELEEQPENSDENKFDISYLDFLDRIDNGSIKPEELSTRLQKMLQVYDLVLNRGTFERINFSIPTDDFLDVFNEFHKEFTPDGYNVMYLISNLYQEYISEIITPYGLCHTYNMAFLQDVINLNSTSDDFHYHHAFRRESHDHRDRFEKTINFPKKIASSSHGLWVGFGYLPSSFKDYYIQNDFDGYVILFHDPYELPSFNSKTLKFNINFRTNIFINPQLNSIDESLYEYEPAERNCYLDNEKVLKFFKVYTKNNCENECMSDFMISRCGCVAFFTVRNPTTRICSANERSCFRKAEEDFVDHKKSCECFDPCEHLKYDYEIHTFGRVDSTAFDVFLTVGFQLQYKSNEINQLVRKEQFTAVDLLSFVGGILGLFAGFSALSFVELIYWFIIRVVIVKFTKVDSKVHPVENVQGNRSKLVELKKFVMSYLSESSIHGFGYVFNSSRITGVLWTFFILTSMTLCLHMIQSTKDSVPESRVIAYDDHFKGVDKIPFPAVTIVPLFTYSLGFNGFQLYLYRNETTREEFKRNITRSFLCHDTFTNYMMMSVAFSIVPHIIPVFEQDSQVDWFRKQYSSFNQYRPEFSEIRTIRGMGFTFNMIDANELLNLDRISSKFSYSRNVTTNSESLLNISKSIKYPLTFGTADQATLTVKLTKASGYTWNCLMQSYVVHNSDDLPTFMTRKDFSPFDFGSTIDITVSPEIIRTDNYLKKLKPSERECYFEGEKSLKYFKKYTQRNCKVECHNNITKEICGCVDIEHPFESPNELCLNISRMLESCVGTLYKYLYSSFNYSPEQNCSCLPLCNSISYNMKYYTKFETKGKETIINVRMNMDDIILYRRYQQFTSSDVVSYVGGLLGLFAGISMLSIVEFVYFFTVRLGVDLWRRFRD